MGQVVTRANNPAPVASEEARQYLTFLLGKEMFALSILHIKEIIEYGQVTSVPMMPAFIRGVINLRGSVVPVIDLSVRFGGGSSQVGKRTCIVIVEIENEEAGRGIQDVGVVVDAVSEVLEIPAGEIEPSPSFGARIRADFIAGMGKVDGRFVIILKAGNVLSLDELAQLADLSQQSPPDGGNLAPTHD